MNNEPGAPLHDPPPENPFASPLVTAPVSYGSRYRRSRDAPTFPKAMAIVDLVFCALRALLIVSALTTVVGNVADQPLVVQ